MHSIIIQGPKIYSDSGIISDGTLLIENGKIDKILSSRDSIAASSSELFNFPSNYSLIPGRIDLHTHGVAGVDVMDATPESLHTITHMLAKEGTTSFLATTMSMPVEAINAAVKNVAEFMQKENHRGARILGLHLEGPFIAASKMGAHQHDYLLKPDVALMQQWQLLANGMIKLVTLAPELEGADALIAYLVELGVVPSIGHSNASCGTACEAIDKGCRHITHLFNAMSGLHHRSPGVALAALERSVLAEIIADGEHVSWEILKFVMRIKGQHELCIVTDSMRAKCMPAGEYELGGQKVYVTQQSACLEDGTLAGSVLTMEQAVKNLIEHQICNLHEAIFLSSVNPAKQLGIFNEVGSITPGKCADLVVIDENYRVVMTLCRGKIAYTAG
ncbi:MAG: N-acetylglucosamine-6-phosphate deacetylase [Gammaproteobacteria bacterium]|nr:N-acetylglucosamine-6-phosphate deacetylase [Gammaproteobacteria bacterium]